MHTRLLPRYTLPAATAVILLFTLLLASSPVSAQAGRQAAQQVDFQSLDILPVTPTETQRGGDIVADPSFEAGRVTDFWTPTNPAYLGGNPIFGPPAGGPDFARTGDWYAILGSGNGPLSTGIEQDITITAGDYTIAVWLLAGDNPGSTSEFYIEFDGVELIRLGLDDVVGSIYDGVYGLVEVPVTVAADGVYTLSFLQENDGTAPDPDFINWFIDDVSVTAFTGPEQVSLPATFDDPGVDYEITDFGGAMSMLVEDPEDATNTVVETLRPAIDDPMGNTCFAGTTIAEISGFVDPIPFAPGDTKMNVRVWSPEAGVRILFKVEEVGAPEINVETFSFTTVAEEWETIVFDFANPMPNTNPINFDNIYNKASIFFDFQCNLPPTSTLPGTYYWDDVAFGDAVQPPIEEAIHDTGLVEFEVYDDGNLGTVSPAPFAGTGFIFDGVSPNGNGALFASTFVVGQNLDQVSGTAYESGDWVNVAPLAEAEPPADFDQAFEASYDDSGAPLPIGVEIEQFSYSSSEPGMDGFVIVEFDVENTTDGDLEDLYVGIFADWDVGTAVANLGGYDEETYTLYVYDDLAGDTQYYGVVALDDNVSGYNHDAGAGTNPTDEDLYNGMTAFFPNPELPADRRSILGVGPYNIAAGETATVRFAYVGGEDLDGLIANARVAQGGGVAVETSTPDGTFVLDSAYPNPFASSTTIGFTLPSAQDVQLTVYDVLGRRVATLIDGVRQAGDQSVRFDASSLPSGMYLYRLEAGGTQLTQRITLVR